MDNFSRNKLLFKGFFLKRVSRGFLTSSSTYKADFCDVSFREICKLGLVKNEYKLKLYHCLPLLMISFLSFDISFSEKNA